MTFTRYTLLALLLSLLWLSALAADQNLPDIGSPADSVLSKEQEQRLGRSIYNSLRQSGSMVTDPEIQEYIQSVGQRLSAAAQNNNFRFTFFVIDSPSINAFAIPGGYIGVHTGLILATRNESELAGVLGHEVAHVTQRHISRAIFASKQESIISLATMLGAVLLGAATGNGDVIAGGVLGSQSMSAQQQINFTRDNEYEADRVGIEFLSASGFNPNGMPDFFETLARKSAGGSEAPEFLRTHPVTVNRIAETRARATMLNFSSVTDSISYSLTRARIRLLTSKTPEKALDYFEAKLKDPDDPGFLGHEYGMALALYDLGRYREAKTILERLMRTHEGVIHFHTGYAATQAALGD
ncbi:MAG: M48 family metalloprotease, partial [Gammaproteobacteria bacterium]|nr:M48 family metalloprotease [Gammaproteobacteria bacterium]